jgi:hypothetical protein
MKLSTLSIVGLLTAFSLVTSVIAETVNPESIVSCRPLGVPIANRQIQTNPRPKSKVKVKKNEETYAFNRRSLVF